MALGADADRPLLQVESDLPPIHPSVKGPRSTAANIVQFASNITYAMENDEDGVQHVFVMRIGDLLSECSVEVYTEPSPHAGKKFKPIHGKQIVFKAGDSITSFGIQLYPDEADLFDGVVEVHCKIKDQSCVNCAVGRFLYQTRLKIIDSDVFPTNKYKTEIERDFTAQDLQASSSFDMLVEIAKHIFTHNPGGAVRILLADQINNCIFISQILFNRAIVNELSSEEPEYSRIVECAVFLAVPYAITHALSYASQFWGVPGRAHECLLHPLIERFLYYDEGSRAMVDCAQFKHTFTEEAFMLVKNSYMQFFVLASLCGRIAMIFFFTLYIAVQRMAISHGPALFIVSAGFLVGTLTIVLYLRLRREGTLSLLKEVNDARVNLKHHVDNCVNNYSLVAENFGRQLVSLQCGNTIRQLNDTLRMQSARTKQEAAFFGWLTITFEFLMTIAMSAAVVFRGMMLGNYTAALFCTKAFTGQLRKVYETLSKMQSCYPAAWHLVEYMNGPTDLEERKAREDARMNMFQERMAAKKAQGVVVEPEDELEITFQAVEFAYFKRAEADSPSSNDLLFCDLNLCIKQGKMLAIVSDAEVGSQTMGRLLNGTLLPTRGNVFVPPHLKTLFVGLDDTTWDGPIAETLFFGLMARRFTGHLEELDQEDLKRGNQICERLNLPRAVMRDIECSLGSPATLRSRVESTKILSSLSKSTLCKIQLACALITDPEVLIVSKLFQRVAPKVAENFMLLLQEYVASRGVEREPDTIGTRRPRTCIIMSSSTLMLSGVDRAVRVKRGGEVNELNVGFLDSSASATLQEFADDVSAYKRRASA